MSPPSSRALAALGIVPLVLLVCVVPFVGACGPSGAPGAVDVDVDSGGVDAYPPPEVAASCAESPSLCGLALHDLGGGDHPNAFHIVFVGDGYLADEQHHFARHARTHSDGVRAPDGVFSTSDLVTRAPELFHFWRVDVTSLGIEIDDAVLTNTPLGAHLGPPDNCAGRPVIRAIEDRFALALDAALLAPIDEARAAEAWPGGRVGSARATFVLLSHRSSGRANATLGGNVRMSSNDGTDVLAHELGHALFHLGDEYTELDSCEPTPGPFTCGPPPDISEVGLLASANTSTLHDGAKWAHDVDGAEPGGNRWPCHAHPTERCLMLQGSSALCPVCASAVEERFARRRCLADTRPPRVAIEAEPAIFDGGRRALLAASAWDERHLGVAAARGEGALRISWTLDGVRFAEGAFAVVSLADAQGRVVRAVADDGRFTQSSSSVALPAPPDAGRADDDQQTGPPALGPIEVAGLPTVAVDLEGLRFDVLGGVGDRVSIELAPTSCTALASAGVHVGRNGHTKSKVLAHYAPPLLVGCEGGPRSVVLPLAHEGRPGDVLDVRGFVVDEAGRVAETPAWTPVVVDRVACPLGPDVTLPARDDGVDDGLDERTLGAFDPIVLGVPPGTFKIAVRTADGRVSTTRLGDAARDGVVVHPIALPGPRGAGFDVDVLAFCDVGAGQGNAAATTAVDVAWDNEPPAIAVRSGLAPFADAVELAVVDGGGVARVEVRRLEERTGELVEGLVLTPPATPSKPWRLSPVPLGPVTIVATDRAGNTSTRALDVHRPAPLDLDAVCPLEGGAR